MAPKPRALAAVLIKGRVGQVAWSQITGQGVGVLGNSQSFKGEAMQRLPRLCPDTAPEAEVPPGALRWSAVKSLGRALAES